MLVLQDFKDMSGLAGGVSKLVMTFTSTGMSMLVSYYFSDWGQDTKQNYTHFHTQRLLYSLAAILVLLELWYWLVYEPIRDCGKPAERASSLRRMSMRLTRHFSFAVSPLPTVSSNGETGAP